MANYILSQPSFDEDKIVLYRATEWNTVLTQVRAWVRDPLQRAGGHDRGATLVLVASLNEAVDLHCCLDDYEENVTRFVERCLVGFDYTRWLPGDPDA